MNSRDRIEATGFVDELQTLEPRSADDAPHHEWPFNHKLHTIPVTATMQKGATMKTPNTALTSGSFSPFTPK